jgi:DNA-binding XRE family transcriptional regulator
MALEVAMDQIQLQLLLGIKLRERRNKLGLSLKELGATTELSPSYLNEIERGKKYPKPEKLLRLAAALDLPFEKLVSPRLDRNLHPLAALLDSPALQKFPFQVFGFTLSDVVHLLSQAPKEAGALVRAMLSITRHYHLGIERFFHAALRSYQALHDNYFPELESAAERCLAQLRARGELLPSLTVLLRELTGAEIQPLPTELRGLRSATRLHPPTLFLDGTLRPSQQAFQIARELAYPLLGLTERSHSSPPLDVETYEQVLNDFKASYFAGAVLLPRASLMPAVRGWLQEPQWRPESLHALLLRFHATPELFFHRLSQLLPAELGLSRCHFLRFRLERGTERFELTKELNMSDLEIPAGLGLQEHFCQRWLSLRVLQELPPQATAPQAGAQRSRFLASSGLYLCLALASNESAGTASSVTLGFQLDKVARSTIAFAEDPVIEERVLGGTCERCPLEGDACLERQAPPSLYQRQLERERMRSRLARLQEG